MVESTQVTVEPAAASDAPLISNLWELYAHDLSDVFSLELGSDARFGNPKLSLYWSEPDRRFPFLIRHGSHIAGFALVARMASVLDQSEVFDVAEFFVVRRHRRSGVGREAAFLLWDRFPGKWTVRVSIGNTGGCRFWAEAVARYSDDVVEELRPVNGREWRIYSFASAGPDQHRPLK
ncbi:putative acetyltransferase [Povalibacter uvarum]|uniref:Putative acetyltransferase n=1 Tax=Povalibacter uvarum TaxID=732238 RepID=A0A841HTJ8_9GAMM|nr:hypothetical protein [Povalibacter uvarum]MBB6095964.1 putative acetyltransferase [Povalibacter uvarum]